MNDDEQIKVTLASLEGQLGRVETVVRMSLAEQRRLNENVSATIGTLIKKHELLESRVGRLENRIAYYVGGLAALTIFVQLILRYVR